MLKKYINKINKQAYTDAATDVGNKAAYHDAVQRIDKMSQHANGDYAIFVMDINYLKMYNDKYGHEFGDMLISDASTIIKRVFGDYNIYRIGGDEFTAIINSPGMICANSLSNASSRNRSCSTVTQSIMSWVSVLP